MKIKKGDLVQVITGKDKGDAPARSSRSTRETNRVLVEGVNRVTKHAKAGQTARGTQHRWPGVHEAPIHVSNVAVVDPDRQEADPGQDPRRDRRANGRQKTVRVRVARALGQGPLREMS